jgi:hypothetical protein
VQPWRSSFRKVGYRTQSAVWTSCPLPLFRYDAYS